MNWEYVVIELGYIEYPELSEPVSRIHINHFPGPEDVLCKFGKSGWELVSTIVNKRLQDCPPIVVAFMKRPVQGIDRKSILSAEDI